MLAAIAVLAAVQRPPIASGEWRQIDLPILAVVGTGALQLIPLPGMLRLALSPSAGDFDRRVGLTAAAGWRPLSLFPGAWLFGVGLVAGAALCFWIARETARAHGGRRLARYIAWMGLAAGLLAVIDPALFPNHRVYGFWEPRSIFHHAGPFISSNHFASWLLLAVPITAGYLAAHVRTHWTDRSRRIQILADARALWLIAAGALMTAALVVARSRAGVIGFVAAAAVGLSRGWRRAGTGARVALLLYIAVLVTAALVWASPDALADKFNEGLRTNAWGGRPDIWRETLGLIARFWPAGVGLGAFDVVMAVYQTSTHAALINHAHDEYLHLFAEGGVLVGVPLAWTAIAFVRLTFQRLRHDDTPMVHVREGALAGIAGLAVQSIWETPLLTPAVFLLLAVAAGLAVHAPARSAAGAERGAGAPASDGDRGSGGTKSPGLA